MKAMSICTAKRAAKITLTTATLEYLFHIQAFFVHVVPDPPNGALIPSYPKARWYETFYNIYLLLLGTIIPACTIIICNAIIITSVNRAAKERKKMKLNAPAKAGKIQEANLTTMLLMTSFAYILCSVPKRMIQALSADYDMTDPYWSARYWLQWWVGAELWHVKFGINFYVYFLGGGHKFRKDAKEVFLRCCSCFNQGK